MLFGFIRWWDSTKQNIKLVHSYTPSTKLMRRTLKRYLKRRCYASWIKWKLGLPMLQRGKLCGNSNTPYSRLSSTNTSQSIFTFTALICALKPLARSLNDRYSCLCNAFFLVPFNNSYSSTPHSCAPFHCSFDN